MSGSYDWDIVGGVFVSPCSGRICLAGRQAGITRFLARVEAEFPVYFQCCVFILGDWGDCVSLKARPLPLPKCEMLRLGDAGLLLFVRTSLSQLGILGRRLVLLLEVKNNLRILYHYWSLVFNLSSVLTQTKHINLMNSEARAYCIVSFSHLLSVRTNEPVGTYHHNNKGHRLSPCWQFPKHFIVDSKI